MINFYNSNYLGLHVKLSSRYGVRGRVFLATELARPHFQTRCLYMAWVRVKMENQGTKKARWSKSWATSAGQFRTFCFFGQSSISSKMRS